MIPASTNLQGFSFRLPCDDPLSLLTYCSEITYLAGAVVSGLPFSGWTFRLERPPGSGLWRGAGSPFWHW